MGTLVAVWVAVHRASRLGLGLDRGAPDASEPLLGARSGTHPDRGGGPIGQPFGAGALHCGPYVPLAVAGLRWCEVEYQSTVGGQQVVPPHRPLPAFRAEVVLAGVDLERDPHLWDPAVRRGQHGPVQGFELRIPNYLWQPVAR